MVSIGRMAREYSMLPSQVAAQATTYDYMVMDVTATYDAWLQDPNNLGDELPEDELVAAMARAKATANGN